MLRIHRWHWCTLHWYWCTLHWRYKLKSHVAPHRPCHPRVWHSLFSLPDALIRERVFNVPGRAARLSREAGCGGKVGVVEVGHAAKEPWAYSDGVASEEGLHPVASRN